MRTVHSKLITLLVVLAMLFVAVAVFSNLSHEHQLHMIFENIRSQREETFKQIMALDGKSLETVAYDYTFWDDMANFVNAPTDMWAEQNLDPSLDTYKTNSFWVYKPDVTLVYSVSAKGDDKIRMEAAPFESLIGKEELAPEKRFYHFFLKSEQGLWEIRGATIHRTADPDRKQNPEGYFFAGRLWDPARLQELSELTRSSIILTDSAKEDLIPGRGKRLSVDRPIVFYYPLEGLGHSVQGYLRVTFENQFIHVFHARAKLQYLTLLIFIGILFVAMVLALARWVFRPLLKVSEALNSQNSQPIDTIAAEQTEFGKVASLIKDFFRQKQTLADSEERMRVLISNIPGAVYRRTADSKGYFDFVSTPIFELTGYTAEEFEARRLSLADLVHPDDRQKVASALAYEKNAGTDYAIEYKIVAKTGTTKWVQDKGRYISGSNGNQPYLHGVLFDVTSMKLMERQLVQSQKMETVGTLAGGIAHDLNNQLTPLLGYINLIQSMVDKNDPKYEMLMEADHATHRAADIVQKLVAFSRHSSQKKNIVSVQTLMSELSRTFSKFLPSTIKCSIVAGVDVWPIHANETEIQTLLMNLVINAKDALPTAGEIVISAANVPSGTSNTTQGVHTQPFVLIKVRDNGSGIAPEVLPHIFEPFFTTKKRAGTGLGLAMAFMIAKDHGGTISVSSEINRGTEFSVYLPARPGEFVGGVEDKHEKPAQLSQKHELILLADDEDNVRNMGRLFLEKLGYRVLTANDSEQAVQIYREKMSEIAVVLLDMTMPKMTGRQCLQKLLETNAQAKVVLVSGFTAEGSTKELLQLGAKDYLPKPYTIGTLSEILHKALNV